MKGGKMKKFLFFKAFFTLWILSANLGLGKGNEYYIKITPYLMEGQDKKVFGSSGLTVSEGEYGRMSFTFYQNGYHFHQSKLLHFCYHDQSILWQSID